MIGFRLVPLDCPSCGAPIAADGDDAVYYCTACKNGYRLLAEGEPDWPATRVGTEPPPPPGAPPIAPPAGSPEGGASEGRAPEHEAPEPEAAEDPIGEPSSDRALVPVEVAFIAAPQIAADRFLPFWLLPAEIEILERKASGGAFRGLVNFFLGGDPEHPGRGTFAIPACDLPLSAATQLARRYTEALPTLGQRLGERLTGGRYGVEDAKKLAEYILIASEVEKPDTLKELRYKLTFGAPRLLGVPFVQREGRLVDAIFGVAAG